MPNTPEFPEISHKQIDDLSNQLNLAIKDIERISLKSIETYPYLTKSQLDDIRKDLIFSLGIINCKAKLLASDNCIE